MKLTLPGVERLPVVDLLGERRAAREEDAAVAPRDGLVELALAQPDRVREREDDRARVERGHRGDHGLAERALGRREPEQRGRLHEVDDLG